MTFREWTDLMALRIVIKRFIEDERGGWFIWLLIGLAINIIAYLLMPKPKEPPPPEVQDMEGPTASADRPAPVVFGTVLVKGVNNLDYRDKNKDTYEVEID